MTILSMTCQRDDGPFLAEWIAHQLSVGFDHVLVLSHDCTDGSDLHMDALASDPRVTHVRFTRSGKKSVQWQALQIIADHPLYKAAEWALFSDCDEYLCLSNETLPQVINDLTATRGDFDALALPWRLLGSAGQTIRTDGLTPERFTMAAPQDLHFPLAHLFKTLHRPGAFQKPGVHRPRSKKSALGRWLGPDGMPLPAQFAKADNAISLYSLPMGPKRLWLNHYSLRSVEEFIVKCARGLPNHETREIGVTYWAERNWNVVHADEILAMLPATRAALAQLVSDPAVQQTLENCRAWHSDRFQTLMQDVNVLRLSFRLGLLTGSTPPSVNDGLAFAQAQGKLLRMARAKS